METDTESLIDRIRAIEEQLEKGIIASAPAEAPPRKEGAPTAETLARRAQLEKAVPEDIKAIVSRWPSVVGETSMPMKKYLKDARLSLGGDNRLMVVVEDGLASDYFLKQEENKKLLEQIISNIAGKEIEVTIQSIRSDRDFAQDYVDLSQIIHMEIEEESE